MPKKKTKFGKRVSLYLSNEALQKAAELSKNRSGLVEDLIFREYARRKDE